MAPTLLCPGLPPSRVVSRPAGTSLAVRAVGPSLLEAQMKPLLSLLLLVAFLLTACVGQGAGVDCDPCAQAEATAGLGGDAASAAAKGGQDANQAPFATDNVSPNAKTTLSRGAGDSRSSSADQDVKHVVSGGAQNCGVILPTNANASNSGGTNPAISEAAKTVASFRAMLQCALMDPTTPPDRIEYLGSQIAQAQESLAQAQAASTVTHVTNNNFQASRINQVPVSSSSSAGRPDPAVLGPVAQAAETVGTAVFSDELYETSSDPSSSPDASAAPDSLPEPPAGAVVETPVDAGGGE